MSLVIYKRLGPVGEYSTIPGQQIIDPNVQGIFGIQDALQLSDLTIALANIGSPVQVVFTATNVGSGFGGGSIENVCDIITGLIADGNGIVVAKLNTAQVCVGPYSGALGWDAVNGGQYEQVSLQSVGSLPAQYAGGSLAGATVYAYVGSHTQFDAYSVGDTFSPDLNVELQAQVTVTGQAPPFSGSGGTSSSGGGTSSGTGTGAGTGTVPTGSGTPTTGLLPTLTTTEKYVLAGAAVAVLGGAYIFSRRL